MESKFGNTENYRILIRDKKGAYSLNPFVSKTEKKFKLDTCSSIITCKKYFAIIDLGKLSLYLTKDCSLFKNFEDLTQVCAVNFSPKEKYLTVIQKPVVDKNLKVFDIEKNFEIVHEFRSQVHPNNAWPQITFSKDEKFLYFHNKTTIEIYEENNLINKIENIIAFEDVQYPDKHLIIGSKVVTLQNSKNKSNKKCTLVTYDFKDFSKPIKEFDTSLTDRAKIKLSLDQKYVLFNSFNDNTSNKSYYGQSSIYFYEIATGRFNKFALGEGPIHDFSWCPNGENFIICAGHLPCASVNFYKKDGNLQKKITEGNFNTVKISPDSRIVALCGFGSLKGDVEFYNLKDFSIIGKCNFFCCCNFNWSQDSKYILGAVLSTRVKVDNEYRILKYNGEEVVVDKDVGEIYDCAFIYEENEKLIKYDEFNIEKNAKSLEEKKKSGGGVKLTSTLGKINFTSNSLNNESNNDDGIVGLGKKKKKKKNKQQQIE